MIAQEQRREDKGFPRKTEFVPLWCAHRGSQSPPILAWSPQRSRLHNHPLRASRTHPSVVRLCRPTLPVLSWLLSKLAVRTSE
jgi:hypothetical protein